MKRALFLVLLAGCPDPEHPPEVWLYGMTGAPPSGHAKIVNDDHGNTYSIDLSTGVAIAAQCSNNCGTQCVPTITVGDADTLEVRPVYRVNTQPGQVALIAKQPGATSLVVEDHCGGTRTYFVQVTPL
jgi:hypothetical protein